MKCEKLAFITVCFVTAILLNSEPGYASGDNPTPSLRRDSYTVSPQVQLPDYYPAAFQRLGVLNEIREQNVWVVNGVKQTISNSVIVHSLSTNFSSLYAVNQGMELGYTKNLDNQIIELWILPFGAIKQN